MSQDLSKQINFDALSQTNRTKFSIVVTKILDAYELNGNRQHSFFGLSIRFSEFQTEGIYPDEIRSVIKQVGGIEELFNDLRYQFKTWSPYPMMQPVIPSIISEDELKQKIFLRIIDLDNLRKIKELIDKKIQEKLRGNEGEKTKIKVVVSKKFGIYTNLDTKKPSYPIRSSSKRFKLIDSLKSGRKDANILMACVPYGYNYLLTKEKNEINENFQSRLGLKDDLVISYPSGGYGLNNDRFEIQFAD